MSDAIIISLITSAAVVISSAITNKKVDKYHKEVNSKMDAALKAAEALGFQKGMAHNKKK